MGRDEDTNGSTASVKVKVKLLPSNKAIWFSENNPTDLVDPLLVPLLVQQLRALRLLQTVGVLLRLLQLDHPPPQRLPAFDGGIGG